MAKARIISAIELGSSKISTLIAQVASDPNTFDLSVNIVGVSSVESRGIRKGQIINIEETVDAAVESIEAAERMAGYNLDSAYVSLGGASISSANSRGVVAVSDADGEISETDVERVIEAASAVSLPASREVVHIIPREYTVDGEGSVKDPIGMSGVRLEVDTHIISASSASIKNLKKALNEVGVNIEEIVFSGLAAAQAVATPTERELGCLVVDIGGGTTSICVFIEGSLAYSGVIPIGAKNITSDLAIGLRISLESAEKVKTILSQNEKKMGKVKEENIDTLDLTKEGITDINKVSKKTLVEGIIRPRLNEIFTMVRLELEKVDLINCVPSGVIITGGGAETVGVIDSAKRMLSLPARIGKPKGVGGLIDDVINPSFSTTVGLILYASLKEPQETLTSFSKRIKLPTKGIAGKLIETVKNLLP